MISSRFTGKDFNVCFLCMISDARSKVAKTFESQKGMRLKLHATARLLNVVSCLPSSILSICH